MCAAEFPIIEPYLARLRTAPILDEIDDVFFEASATKTFASADARAAFRHRWLGRYLADYSQHAFLAIVRPGAPDARLAGYIVGTVDDPAQDARFDDLPYFKSLAHLTERYPAQLHVNLAPEWRGRGVGRALVDAFCVHAREAGAAGVHVFTGRNLRNVGFYQANAFAEVGAVEWNGREIVMLGRDLA